MVSAQLRGKQIMVQGWEQKPGIEQKSKFLKLELKKTKNQYPLSKLFIKKVWARKSYACPGNGAELYTDLALNQYGPDTEIIWFEEQHDTVLDKSSWKEMNTKP